MATAQEDVTQRELYSWATDAKPTDLTDCAYTTIF